VWVTPKHIGKPDDIAKIVSVCRDLSPTILFLEDVDLFSGDRGGNSDNSVLGELMNQLDGIQENTDIITIATTNRAEVIEKALIDRPGRFDKVIEFSIPDESIRAKLLKYFIKDLHLDAEVDITVLSKLTNGLAGAHIRELVNLAVLTAIDEGSFDNNKLIHLKRSHFRVALASVKKKDFSKLGFGISKLNSEFHDYLLEDPL
jgi:ATP-dependent 26S proteasome regulatory subunit